MAYKYCLIVEDEKEIADLLAKYVSRLGYMSVICSSGTDALVKIDRQKFDYILLDLNLPKMSGPEFLTQIFKQNHNGVLKHPLPNIVVVTGELQDHLRDLNPFLGNIPILDKPFTYDQVKEVFTRSQKSVMNKFSETKLDHGIIYNFGLLSILDKLKEISQSAKILSEQSQTTPFIITNPVVIVDTYEIQEKIYDLIYSIPYDWCLHTSTVLNKYIQDAELSEEAKVDVITFFFEDVGRNFVNKIETKTSKVSWNGTKVRYNTEESVSYFLDSADALLQTHLDTSYGYLNFLLTER